MYQKLQVIIREKIFYDKKENEKEKQENRNLTMDLVKIIGDYVFAEFLWIFYWLDDFERFSGQCYNPVLNEWVQLFDFVPIDHEEEIKKDWIFRIRSIHPSDCHQIYTMNWQNLRAYVLDSDVSSSINSYFQEQLIINDVKTNVKTKNSIDWSNLEKYKKQHARQYLSILFFKESKLNKSKSKSKLNKPKSSEPEIIYSFLNKKWMHTLSIVSTGYSSKMQCYASKMQWSSIFIKNNNVNNNKNNNVDGINKQDMEEEKGNNDKDHELNCRICNFIRIGVDQSVFFAQNQFVVSYRNDPGWEVKWLTLLCDPISGKPVLKENLFIATPISNDKNIFDSLNDNVKNNIKIDYKLIKRIPGPALFEFYTIENTIYAFSGDDFYKLDPNEFDWIKLELVLPPHCADVIYQRFI